MSKRVSERQAVLIEQHNRTALLSPPSLCYVRTMSTELNRLYRAGPLPQAVMARCRGGYAVTVLINGYGILAFRDPHGVRPLCLGARPGGGGADSGVVGGGAAAAGGGGAVGGGGVGADGRRRGSGKMDLAVASESAALTGLGFSLRRDVGAGEAVYLDVSTGSVSSQFCSPRQQQQEQQPPQQQQQHQQQPLDGEGNESDEAKEEGGEGSVQRAIARFKPCLFEYVYMARPDSIIDGVPVRLQSAHRIGLLRSVCVLVLGQACAFRAVVA